MDFTVAIYRTIKFKQQGDLGQSNRYVILRKAIELPVFPFPHLVVEMDGAELHVEEVTLHVDTGEISVDISEDDWGTSSLDELHSELALLVSLGWAVWGNNLASELLDSWRNEDSPPPSA